MSVWKKVKIGDFLTEREGRYKPDDSKISKYKRLEKIDFSGTIHISDKPTKTDMIIVHPGDLVISGINVAKGAVAVYQGNEPVCATIHYSSYTFDSSKVDLDYFKYFVKSPAFIAALQKQVKGGIKTEIKPRHLLPLEISIPDLQTQQEIVKKISSQLQKTERLSLEIESQKNYAKLLRQNILQNAIEGKLTEDWRKQNPVQKGNPDYDAEALFEQILKEKISYTAELHLKSMNFPKINDEEVSFDSKNNWVYARGDDCFNIRSASRIHQSDWKTSGIPFLRGRELVQLAKYGKVINPETYISEEFYNELKQKSGIPSKNDLLVSAVGTLGKVYIVQETDKFYYKDAYILCFENYHKLNAKFFSLVISSPYYQKEIYKESKGTTVAQFTIGRAKFIPFPLPPLKEQEEIVNKVENLLAKVTELENQIQERKTLSEKLAFGIIKEKLEG